MAKIREMFGLNSRIKDLNFLAGMECEIEAVADYALRPLEAAGWAITEDGSLRNNGREFISNPMNTENLLAAFGTLHNPSNLVLKKDPFSERTSIHVHVNCLDLDEAQVKNIMLWYALFEPYFFMMAKPERQHNIHCVQLNQTTLPEMYKRALGTLVSKWSKYTALNLLPLKELGTVEFRHMHGTKDAILVGQWLRTIENLWRYGQLVPMTADVMESEGKIKEGFDFIFRDAGPIATFGNTIPFHTRDSSIDVKLGVF